MEKVCKTCEYCDHENYDDDIKFVKVLTPDTKQVIMTRHLCKTHRDINEFYGYIIEELESEHK